MQIRCRGYLLKDTYHCPYVFFAVPRTNTEFGLKMFVYHENSGLMTAGSVGLGRTNVKRAEESWK